MSLPGTQSATGTFRLVSSHDKHGFYDDLGFGVEMLFASNFCLLFGFLHAFFSVGGQPGLPSKHGVLLESIIQRAFHGFIEMV